MIDFNATIASQLWRIQYEMKHWEDITSTVKSTSPREANSLPVAL
jgi:hypothetical protein